MTGVRSTRGCFERIGTLGSPCLRPREPCRDLVLTADGQRLLCCGKAAVRVFDATRGALLATHPLAPKDAEAGALVPEQGWVLLARKGVVTLGTLDGGKVGRWQGAEGDPSYGIEAEVGHLVPLAGGRRLLSYEIDSKYDAAESEFMLVCSEDFPHVCLRELPSGKVLWRYPDGVAVMTTSPDGRHALEANGRGGFRLRELAGGEVVARWEMATTSHAPRPVVALAPSGELCLTGTEAGVVEVRTVPDGRLLETWRIPDGDGRPTCLAVTPDGRRALVGTWEGTVSLRRMPGGEPGERWPAHVGSVTHLLVDAGSERVYTAGADDDLHCFRIPTGEALLPTAGHRGWITALALVPGSTLLVSGGYDGTVRVWNHATGACERVHAGHHGPVRTLQVTPDGRNLLTGGKDGAIRRWDLRTGREIRRFRARRGRDRHQVGRTPDGGFNLSDEPVRALAVSPDGETFAVGSGHGPVVLRETLTSKVLARSESSTLAIEALAFSPDGTRLLAVGDLEKVLVLDARDLRVVQESSGKVASLSFAAWREEGASFLVGARRGGRRGELLWEGRVGTRRLAKLVHPLDFLVGVVPASGSPHEIGLGEQDGTPLLGLWRDRAPRRRLDEVELPSPARRLATHGDRVAVASEDSTILVFRVQAP